MAAHFKVMMTGITSALALVLDDRIIVDGGIDFDDGRIIGQHHPQVGERIVGRALVFPNSAPFSVRAPAELINLFVKGVQPAALILSRAVESEVLTGLLMADQRHSIRIPTAVCPPHEIKSIKSMDIVRFENTTVSIDPCEDV